MIIPQLPGDFDLKLRRLTDFWGTDRMSPAYLGACADLLPQSQSVIDRFHVAQKLGAVADALRKK